MSAAPIESPFSFGADFHANSRFFPFNSELPSFNCKPLSKISRISLYPSTNISKGYVGRIQAFCDNDQDSLWEENATPIQSPLLELEKIEEGLKELYVDHPDHRIDEVVNDFLDQSQLTSH